MGRQNKYYTHIQPCLDKVAELAETMSEKDIAHTLGVAPSSFETYKSQHEELRKALEEGRAKRRSVKIKRFKSLLEKRGEGFHYTETKRIVRNIDGVKTQIVEEYEKYSPPDVGALHLLLKNLDEEWHNDDSVTINMKKERIALDKLKAEMNNW